MLLLGTMLCTQGQLQRLVSGQGTELDQTVRLPQLYRQTSIGILNERKQTTEQWPNP